MRRYVGPVVAAVGVTLLLTSCSSATGSAAGPATTAAATPEDPAVVVQAELTDALSELSGAPADVTARDDDGLVRVRATVVFPASSEGEQLVDAARSVYAATRGVAARGGVELVWEQLELVHEGGREHSARWNDATVGPDVEVESELWARLVDTVPVAAIHVWHDDGHPLKVQALGTADAEVASREAYAAMVDAMTELGLDPASAEVSAWTDHPIQAVQAPRIRDEVLDGVAPIYGLSYLSGVEVLADPAQVRLVLYLAIVEGTADRVPFAEEHRVEILDILETAGALVEGTVVEVVTPGDVTVQVWPAA